MTQMIECEHQNLPLAALLADTAGEVRGNLAPSLRAILFDALHENTIFLLSPGSFDHLRIEHFLPAVEALDIGAILELLGNFLPVFRLNNRS